MLSVANLCLPHSKQMLAFLLQNLITRSGIQSNFSVTTLITRDEDDAKLLYQYDEHSDSSHDIQTLLSV